MTENPITLTGHPVMMHNGSSRLKFQASPFHVPIPTAELKRAADRQSKGVGCGKANKS